MKSLLKYKINVFNDFQFFLSPHIVYFCNFNLCVVNIEIYSIFTTELQFTIDEIRYRILSKLL